MIIIPARPPDGSEFLACYDMLPGDFPSYPNGAGDRIGLGLPCGHGPSKQARQGSAGTVRRNGTVRLGNLFQPRGDQSPPDPVERQSLKGLPVFR
jgi:hypothetical protein